jgi:transcriptional regulator with XRE-family HTH domain
MQTIGERLEEARKRKGISIREAAETTKIRSDYLQKFEANSFDVDLPPLYLRGFLRAYARFLELDPERLLNDFNTVLAEGKPARRETREVYGRVDFADGARAAEGGTPAPVSRSAQDQALLIKLGLIAVGALLAVVAIVMLVKVLFFGAPAKATSSASVAAAQVGQSREATFTVTLTGTTRIKVAYLDNSMVFLDGKFARNKGETKTIRYSKDLIVTVEFPDRIKIELNGRLVDVPTDKQMGQFRVPFEAPQ